MYLYSPGNQPQSMPFSGANYNPNVTVTWTYPEPEHVELIGWRKVVERIGYVLVKAANR